MSGPIVIAEIGLNHQGNFKKAKEMIEVAAWCGVKYVKFQKRDIDSLPESTKTKQRTDIHAYGATEFEHRKALEFSIQQHKELKNFAEEHGLRYSCSAWDKVSYGQLVDMNLDYIKIPSAKNIEFFNWMPRFTVTHHISLGMTTNTERMEIRSNSRRFACEIVPYICTSTYPCENKDVYLLDIKDLATAFMEVGFSGHHRGIQLDVGALALGAKYFERHFTLDRASKGTDQAASLEPDAMRKLVRDLDIVYESLKYKPSHLPECEKQMYLKFKGQ